MRGSLLFTVLVLVAAEAGFLYYTISSNYDSARRAMQSRASTLVTQLSVTEASTPAARETVLRRMVEQFTEKDKFELMLVDRYGRVAATTTGYSSGQAVGEDWAAAVAAPAGTASAVYRTQGEEEKVMALTVLLPVACGDIAALRLVTSLTLLDSSIATITFASLCLVAAILGFSIWSGMFFVRSIVRPIGVIETTAAQIAAGNLDIRIENKYDDEIGKLAGTINHMAGELDKTERMKNEFISSVSHELRTPLTSIKGWVETIAHIDDPENPNFRRGVQVISSETDRLYAMVEELLDFSRMQNGLKLEPQMLDLVAEISDTALMVGQRVKLEGLQLQWDEPEQPVPVWADPGRLRQVLVNLLDNAVKYSPPGGTIAIELLQDGKNAFVNIIDQGPGISAEDLENVKVKFYKGKGAVRGSGIGLAVVDEILTAHGGSLQLQSTLGQGTTATVRLPIYHKEGQPPAGALATERNNEIV